jgi:hypothetical protein
MPKGAQEESGQLHETKPEISDEEERPTVGMED